ncbi:MAG TPA: hypothetical protein DCG57_09135 [Candidatus Riflebacteria bacterium]|jgi:hypothetical protein|nr:hypothetical protein [Candidatus Riflebacteria bacterium]
MQSYIEFVTTWPIVSAMLQFAVLGTFGDVIAKWIIEGRVSKPFGFATLLAKMLEWAILAVLIKYAFTGFAGFVDSLVQHKMLPELSGWGRAIAISVATNLQFGPFLVLMHRLLDNLIARKSNWANIDKGFMSLLWFWIPAHSVTFALPKPYQIGLAAVWSVALGIILGFYNRKPAAAS